jgi:hypothetical protein
MDQRFIQMEEKVGQLDASMEDKVNRLDAKLDFQMEGVHQRVEAV